MDDRPNNGAAEFEGEWIQFGSPEFPDWQTITEYLLKVAATNSETESESGQPFATLEDAIAIAAQAHQGKTDKAGTCYILHPLRMMMKMETEAERMTAILHDVVEDSEWTLEGLREAGFSAEVLEAVDGVTNRSGESYEQFIERAACNPIARQVKIADLEDNMNILRIGEIKSKDLQRLEKYHKSWRSLTSA